MIEITNSSLILTDEKNNALCISANNYLLFDNSIAKKTTGAIKINYCPMCGRNLSDVSEKE